VLKKKSILPAGRTVLDLHGVGSKPGTNPKKCPECNGSGRSQADSAKRLWPFCSGSYCPKCEGEGTVITDPCVKCGGHGKKG